MNLIRKYFEDLSFTEGVLLVSTISFAVFIRFYGIEVQEPWTDELATWFYLRNVDQIFPYESHSPLYYLVLRFLFGSEASLTSLRIFSASFSVLSLITVYFLGRRFLDKNKALAIVILLAFSPADIVHSRMARHYSILLQGTMIFLFMMKGNVRTWIVSLFAALMGFVHVFFLIPMTIILGFDYFRTKNLKKNLLIFTSSLGILVYYILRIIIFGSGHVGDSVSWNGSGFHNFMNQIAAQFLGDAYPRFVIYPTDLTLAWTLVGGLFFFICYKRKESALLLISVVLGSVLFIEICNLAWVNFRINRYVIYLCGLMAYALVDSFKDIKWKHLLILYFGSLILIVHLNLLANYPWDDEVIRVWKKTTGDNPQTNQLVCSNRYQSAYYELKAPLLCGRYIQSIDTSKPLLFLDLNNNDSFVTVHLMNRMRPVLYKNFRHSKIIHFEPR